MKLNNKGAVSALVWVLVIALVGGGALVATGNMPGLSTSSDTETPTLPTGESFTCNSDTTPDLLINAYDSENVGTAITEAGMYRKDGTLTWIAFTVGTAITNLEPGATYEFIPGINPTDELDNAFGTRFKHTILCQETETIEIEMQNDEIETSLVATFYNVDNNAAAQVYAAGDRYTVAVKLKAGSDEFFGNPNLNMPNIFVVKLNGSEWDVPLGLSLADGTELKSIAIPLRYDVEALATSGMSQYAWELPAISDRNTWVYLDLKADDSTAPGNSGTKDGTAYIFAGGYWLNDKTGEVTVGVDTETGADAIADASDSVVLDFT